MTREELWQKTADNYEYIIANYPYHQPLVPMVPFIYYLRDAGFWHQYYPLTSHYTLVLSPFRDFDKMQAHRSVGVAYHPESKAYTISYSYGKHEGQKACEETHSEVMAAGVVRKIEDWLGLEGYEPLACAIFLHHL